MLGRAWGSAKKEALRGAGEEVNPSVRLRDTPAPGALCPVTTSAQNYWGPNGLARRQKEPPGIH